MNTDAIQIYFDGGCRNNGKPKHWLLGGRQKGKQVIAYSGLFKEYMLKCKANELEQYMEKDKNEYFYKIMANWRADQSDFVLEYIHLTELEKAK